MSKQRDHMHYEIEKKIKEYKLVQAGAITLYCAFLLPCSCRVRGKNCSDIKKENEELVQTGEESSLYVPLLHMFLSLYPVFFFSFIEG